MNIPTYKKSIASKHLNYIQSNHEIWKAIMINLEVSFLCINLFLHVSFEHNYVSWYSGEMSTQYSWHKPPQAYLPDVYKD